MKKELCKCGKMAVWVYMPGDGVYCDECVPRGCFCNHRFTDPNSYSPPLDAPEMPEGVEGIDWKWIAEGVCCELDENGKEFPCCEYMYDGEGWDIG